MAEVSPAVERAASLARQLADENELKFAHWLVALLDDDDGRPAEMLSSAGVELPSIRTWLNSNVDDSPNSPTSNALFARARDLALQLKADPALTTDGLLLAVLTANEEYAERLRSAGVPISELVDRWRSPLVEATSETFAVLDFERADPPEHRTAARIVDANANRAREALRVLDDYARFVLDDAVLTERFKTLRHELAAAVALLNPALLLSCRDVGGDVGTGIGLDGEYRRIAPSHVAEVNLKRLQEALRSLEEYGKILSGPFARAVERLRYETYNLERTIVRSGPLRSRLAGAKLMALLGSSTCSAALDWTISEVAAGGVDIVQLREKGKDDRDWLDRAREARRATRAAGVLLIVNDRPDLAAAVEADGVHLGQTDLPISVARRLLGSEAIIGVSTHDANQVKRAVLDGADYLGLGPTFPTSTKSFDKFPGLDFIAEAVLATSLPAFAIGGIGLGNIAEVVATGCRRIAVSSVLATADDPQAVAAALRRVLD